jgi:hypothetical protein
MMALKWITHAALAACGEAVDAQDKLPGFTLIPAGQFEMGASNIRIISRDKIKFPEPANLQPIGLVQVSQ